MIRRISAVFFFVLIFLTITPALAHNGFHTGLFHPLSGPDHFAVVLIIAFLVFASTYYFFKK